MSAITTEERISDARWRAIRLLVEFDAVAPNDAHALVYGLEPAEQWSPIYKQARNALKLSRVPEPQSKVVDMRLWLSARLSGQKRNSRPRRPEL